MKEFLKKYLPYLFAGFIGASVASMCTGCGDDESKKDPPQEEEVFTGLLVGGLYDVNFLVTRDDRTPENVGYEGDMEWVIKNKEDNKYTLLVAGNTVSFPGEEVDGKVEFFFEEEMGQKFDGCENINKIWASLVPDELHKNFTGPIIQMYHYCPLIDAQNNICLACTGEMWFNADVDGTLKE